MPNGYGAGMFSTKSGNDAEGKKPALAKQGGAMSSDQVPDAKILQTLAKYLWMKDNYEFRLRVLAALGLLVGAKVSEKEHDLICQKSYICSVLSLFGNQLLRDCVCVAFFWLLRY